MTISRKKLATQKTRAKAKRNLTNSERKLLKKRQAVRKEEEHAQRMREKYGPRGKKAPVVIKFIDSEGSE